MFLGIPSTRLGFRTWKNSKIGNDLQNKLSLGKGFKEKGYVKIVLRYISCTSLLFRTREKFLGVFLNVVK